MPKEQKILKRKDFCFHPLENENYSNLPRMFRRGGRGRGRGRSKGNACSRTGTYLRGRRGARYEGITTIRKKTEGGGLVDGGSRFHLATSSTVYVGIGVLIINWKRAVGVKNT